MSTNGDSNSLPRSMRHKQILDVAAENPDASIEELASEVPSATPELVERVFEKHGDPASDGESSQSQETMNSDNESIAHDDQTETTNSTTEATDETADHSAENPAADEAPAESLSLDDVSDRQRELLEAVAARPDATQKELATHFDVTRATISRWANEIEGFEWSDREAFVDAVFEKPQSVDLAVDGGAASETETPDADQTETGDPSLNGGDKGNTERVTTLQSELDHLEERITALESSGRGAVADPDSVFDDPELVHKIVHACMDSDSISEAEELRILKELLS